MLPPLVPCIPGSSRLFGFLPLAVVFRLQNIKYYCIVPPYFSCFPHLQNSQLPPFPLSPPLPLPPQAMKLLIRGVVAVVHVSQSNSLPSTSTWYEWLIHPRWLLTLQVYVPVSDGTTSFKRIAYFPSKYNKRPLFSLKGFPFLYHAIVRRGYPLAEQSSFTELPTGRTISVCCRLRFDKVNLGAAVRRKRRVFVLKEKPLPAC